MRRPDVAADLAEKLDDVPGPVLLVQLHRRVKELIDIADLLAIGTPAAALVRTLKLNPYRAEKLAEQARTWTLPELDAAMAGLLEMDADLKNGSRRRAAISLWIAEKVRRPSGR
jgi:DNA polymerase III delta subunit